MVMKSGEIIEFEEKKKFSPNLKVVIQRVCLILHSFKLFLSIPKVL